MIALFHRLPQPVRDSLLFAGALGWTKALSLLTVPLLTATLTQGEFARLELLSSAAELGALLVGAGLVDTAYRFAGRDDASGRRAMGDTVGLALSIALIAIGAVAVAAPAIGAAMPLTTPPVEIALLGTAVAMEALIGVPLAWLRIRGRAGQYALAIILRTTIQVILVAAFAFAGWGVAGVLAAGACAAVGMAAVLLFRQARTTGIRLDPRSWASLLAYGMPLVGGGFAAFILGSADRWLLAGVASAESLAMYALACKISLVAALLTQPFELWWYPRRIAILDEPNGPARAGRIVMLGVLLTLSAASATAIAGPLVIQVLTPAPYHAAGALVPWIALTIALQSMGSLLNVGCYVGRTGLPSMMINGTAAMMAVGLYVVLIPPFGVWGAIAATIAAQTARCLLFLTVSQRRVHLPLSVAPIFAPAMIALVAPILPPLVGVMTLGLAGLVACLTGIVPLPASISWPGRAARA